MPQIQQYGTNNVLACWQGIGGPTFTIRAAFQCTLTRVALGHFKLAINLDLEDADTQVMVDTQDGILYSIRIVWNADGTADILFSFSGDGTAHDPGLFNILVTQCTDCVNAIEGNP